jgi:hypothetical protein
MSLVVPGSTMLSQHNRTLGGGHGVLQQGHMYMKFNVCRMCPLSHFFFITFYLCACILTFWMAVFLFVLESAGARVTMCKVCPHSVAWAQAVTQVVLGGAVWGYHQGAYPVRLE